MRLLILAFGAIVAVAFGTAAPAAAEPGMPNCGQLSFVCTLIPTMPDLEHDIDLTRGQPPVPPAEDLPPADVCAVGCI